MVGQPTIHSWVVTTWRTSRVGKAGATMKVILPTSSNTMSWPNSSNTIKSPNGSTATLSKWQIMVKPTIGFQKWKCIWLMKRVTKSSSSVYLTIQMMPATVNARSPSTVVWLKMLVPTWLHGTGMLTVKPWTATKRKCTSSPRQLGKPPGLCQKLGAVIRSISTSWPTKVNRNK